MKIIQLIQKPQRRGAEIFTAQLSEALSHLGHEVLLVSIFYGDGELPFKGEHIKLNRPIHFRFFDLKGWRRFAVIVKSFRPDIIQANAADTLKFSIFSKKIFRWNPPIIYRNANQMGDFIKNKFHWGFNNWLINEVGGIISVSKASQKDLHLTFKIKNNQLFVIPIGIDPKEIEKGLTYPIDVNLPSKYLLQIGSLVPEKNPFKMLSIFSKVVTHFPDLNLVFLGSGKLEKELRIKINQFGLQEKVLIIPAKQNVYPILKRAKALVMPSIIEGLPGVILEAMYCKVPVVAYGVGGISEVLKSEVTGWCVEPGDSNKFQESIKDVLLMEKNKQTIVTDRAKELIKAEYFINDISIRFSKYYQTVK